MKKLIIIALLFAACRSTNHNGFYVNHTIAQFSIADDTLEVKDSVIIEHTGYQRIRNGLRQPKEYKTNQLFELQPRFEGNKLILNHTTYEKI